MLDVTLDALPVSGPLAALILATGLVGWIMRLVAVVHAILCVFIILVVLLQRGKAGDLASAFGGGPSQPSQAAMSSEDFLTQATKWGAGLFMVTSLVLALFAHGRSSSVLDEVPGDDTPPAVSTTAPGETPAADGTAATQPVATPAATPATGTPATGTPPADPPAESDPEATGSESGDGEGEGDGSGN